MSIEFPNKSGVITQNCTIAFPARLNGIDVSCEISFEALEDNFERSPQNTAELLEVFEQNRKRIESVARSLLPARGPHGRCLLVSKDF